MIIDLNLLQSWGLWTLWGTLMMGLGWRIGAARGRRLAEMRRQGRYMLVDSWFPLVKLERPTARLSRDGRPEGE